MRTAAFSMLVLFFPLAASAQTAAPPVKPAPGKSAPACLRQSRVWGWKAVDNKTLIVTDTARNAFTVSLRPGCFDLKWHHRSLDFRSFSGSSLSCLQRSDYVLVPPGAGRQAQRCRIADVVAYVPPPK
jgi:hypothetical protein